MILRAHAVLSAISRRYSSLEGRSPMCYSPVRHSLAPKSESVRLACVRHAASVYPEPGSNSPSKDVSTLLAWSSGNAQWLSCDPGQAAVQCCPYLAVRRCIASCLPPWVGRPARSKKLPGTACWCVGRDPFSGAFFALTKKQLLFCFPLFSC